MNKMKKEWKIALFEELNIAETKNGRLPSMNFDGDWTQIDGLWFIPGHADGECNEPAEMKS